MADTVIDREMRTTRKALRCSSRPGWAAALVVALVGVLAVPAQAAGGSGDESVLLALTNTARSAAGVAPLTAPSLPLYLTVMLEQARALGGRP
jgi:hypothetical protein